MGFLTKEQFERQNFTHYIRTGEYYHYEDYLKWFIKQDRKMEKKSLGIDPENFNPNPSKTYCIWSGGSCGGCSSMAGQIFEITDIPDTHPNCSCSWDVIDDLGECTWEKIKPKIKEKENPEPKEPCAKLTSGVGSRNAPVAGASSNHKGVDISAPKGTPINAIEGGKITHSGLGKSGINGGLGFFVEITNANGDKSRYGHMDGKPDVDVGDFVETGDKIGEVGSTGYSSGNHLHFDVKDSNNNYTNPTDEQIQDFLDMLNEGCNNKWMIILWSIYTYFYSY